MNLIKYKNNFVGKAKLHEPEKSHYSTYSFHGSIKTRKCTQKNDMHSNNERENG